MTVRPNNKKKNLKGRFEPVIDQLFRGMADEYGYEVHYEPTVYTLNITHDYTPDFEIVHPDGRRKVFEVKGFFRYDDQRKAIAFRKDFPDVDYRLIFQKDNPIRKGSKLTYSGWAEKNGIPASVGTIPKEWLV